MYKIGLDRTGIFDHMSNATDMGMAAVFHPMLAALADDMTGATINATTAGRIPIKMFERVSLFFMRSGVRNIAIARIMVNEGRIVPMEAVIAPFIPRSLSPTATEMFTARMPGKDCATASRSRNSSRSIHFFLSTISFSISDIIAQPPPKVNAPILKNDMNNCQ